MYVMRALEQMRRGRTDWSIPIGLGLVVIAGLVGLNMWVSPSGSGVEALTDQERGLLFTAADLAEARPDTKWDPARESFSKSVIPGGDQDVLQLEYTYQGPNLDLRVLKSVIWATASEEQAIALFRTTEKEHGQIALSFEADLYRRDNLLSEPDVDCSIVTLYGGHIWGNVCFIRRGRFVYHYGLLGYGVQEEGGLDPLLQAKVSALDQYDPE